METTCDTQIEEIVQSIFKTMLDMDVTRGGQQATIAPESLLATVQITGPQARSLVLGLSAGAIRSAAAAMLQFDADDVTEADERDVAAELTNMIGGNFKGLLQSPSCLSLPTVVAGRDLGLQVPGAELIEDVSLQCDGGSLRVRLFAPVTG